MEFATLCSIVPLNRCEIEQGFIVQMLRASILSEGYESLHPAS